MNRSYKSKLLHLLIVVMVSVSCGNKQAVAVKSFVEVKQPGESDEDALYRLENELMLRNFLSDSSLTSLDSIAMDSVIVFSDTIKWAKRSRKISKSTSLDKFTTKSLETIYGQKVIYGVFDADNRKDWYDADPRSQATSLQTACLVEKNKLVQLQNGNYTLKSRPFSEAKYLCSTERFYEQPVSGFCSGFAVSSNLVITAGHCINKKNLSDFVIVFDFKMVDKETVKKEYLSTDIYLPIEIVDSGWNEQGVDYGILKVNRTIPKHRIALIREQRVKDSEPIFVMGHPCGLPIKIANQASVKSNSNLNFFSTDLDTYGGNSGSPVYDTAHQIVGILVRGATDFKYDYQNKCYISRICETMLTPDCGGEFVSRTNQFIQTLKLNAK